MTIPAYFFAALAWKKAFTKDHKSKIPGIFQLFAYRQIGEVVSLLTPANVIGGEISKISLLSAYNIPKTHLISSVVISRGLIILSYLFLILIGLIWVFVIGGRPALIYYIAGVIGIFVCTVTLGIYIRDSVNYNFRNKLRWLKKIDKEFRTTSALIREQLSENRKQLSIAFIFSLIHWLVGVFEFYIILNGLGISCTYPQAFILEIGVIIFKCIGAFVPAQLGFEEYGNKLMLAFIGIPSVEIWIVVSLIRRARQIIWITIGLLLISIILKKRIWKFSL